MPDTALQRILYIENDETLARLLRERMQRHNVLVDFAASAEDGLQRLQQVDYDVLLVDHHLRGMSGLALLDVLAGMQHTPPAIILIESGDDRAAVAALEKGAADYAIKDTSQTYLELLYAVMQAAYTKHRLLHENEVQRQELLAAKEKAESANRAKSAFLATMSHEMRTPLNVVIGLARLLDKLELGQKERQMVRTLLTNADLLLRLINDLLDISRIEAGVLDLETADFEFSTVLNDVRTMFHAQAASKNLRFSLIDETRGSVATGDRTRVQQILMNLVANALKFTDRGEISVHAVCTPHEGGNTQFTITVRDTGIGIPSGKLERIFDKFSQADESITRRFGGSGLGLSIARSLAKRMGGNITAESTPGFGAVFTVTLLLPAAGARMIAGKAPKETPKVPHATNMHRTVLIVEDYAPNVMVATMMLENLGFEAVAAENGATALACIERTDAPYAAILMDVQMQDMDGFETTRRVRALEARKGFRNYIIGVTAHALAGDRERCISAGMDDYMSKPIHPDLLTAKLLLLMEVSREEAA